MLVVDTNVLSELMHPTPDTPVASWVARRATSSLYLTAISEAELRFGLAIMPPGRRRSIQRRPRWRRAILFRQVARGGAQGTFCLAVALHRLVPAAGEPTPTDADRSGEWYCFERGARKDSGGDGWADVWKRVYFAWEYKGKRADLDAAFRARLNACASSLHTPPDKTGLSNSPARHHRHPGVSGAGHRKRRAQFNGRVSG